MREKSWGYKFMMQFHSGNSEGKKICCVCVLVNIFTVCVKREESVFARGKFKVCVPNGHNYQQNPALINWDCTFCNSLRPREEWFKKWKDVFWLYKSILRTDHTCVLKTLWFDFYCHLMMPVERWRREYAQFFDLWPLSCGNARELQCMSLSKVLTYWDTGKGEHPAPAANARTKKTHTLTKR